MKNDYFIDKVSKEEIKNLFYLLYLKDESKDFKSGYNYSLYRKSFTNVLNIGGSVGVCIFTDLPVPEIAKLNRYSDPKSVTSEPPSGGFVV